MISVVIPTFHRNEALARCLEHLAPSRQSSTAHAIEVIVSDDGKLTTAQRLVGDRFPWARWIAGPRRGPAANRNHGVRHALGEWIAFIDDDCVPEANWLAAFNAVLAPGVDVYEGRTTCNAGLTRFREDAPVNLTGGNLPSCNMMIDRAAFEAVGGFDGNFPQAAMEDYDLRERLLAAGHSMRFVPDATVDHPPRPRLVGTRLGAQWESRVYYHSKWRHRSAFRRWLPLFILKVRLREMCDRYPLLDYPAALWSLGGELRHVMQHVSRWEKKYARPHND